MDEEKKKVWMVKKGGLAGNGAGRQKRVNDKETWTILMSPKYSKYIVPFPIYASEKFDLCFIIL